MSMNTDTQPRVCPVVRGVVHCEVRDSGVFHTFLCFIANLCSDFNRSAGNQGAKLNAR